MKKPPTANEDDLAKHFAKFGLVDHVSVAKDKNGGDGHKGFAFITFQDKQVSKTIPCKKIISSKLFHPRSREFHPQRQKTRKFYLVSKKIYFELDAFYLEP